MGSVLAVLNAIVDLLPVIKQLVNLYSEAKLKGWIKDGSELQQKIQNSKDEKERMDLAQSLFNHRAK